MGRIARTAALAWLGTAGIFVLTTPAQASSWMTEQAMRVAFIGKTLDGRYVSGESWTETYTADGRLDYRERARKGLGYWYFRGRAFCTFYDPGQGLYGGCFTAVQAGANCYEFHFAALGEPGDALRPWVARAWRRGEPSTCEASPAV